MPPRSPPIPARFPPVMVPAECRLGHRRYRLSACSVSAGASSVPARFPPITVLARCRLGPRRCLLGSRWCRLDACSVTAGAGLVPAGAGSVHARCLLGFRRSVSACACSIPTGVGSVPVHFFVYPDQISPTPRGSISIDSPELQLHPSLECLHSTTSDLSCASMLDPRAAFPKTQPAHHND